mgnify:CR=1 FL=1
MLEVRLRDVRAMLGDNELVAERRGESQALSIHRDQLVRAEDRWEALPSLRGTVTALKDAGLSDDEASRWLLAPNEDLGETPLHALRQGRIHVVRRICQTLAF